MNSKKIIASKAFSLAKTPIGGLIVGLAFGKFSKALPVKKIKETDKVVTFWHPQPFWKKHILIVPKKPIKSLLSLSEKDMVYINEVFEVAREIIKKLKWDKKEYTLLINGGKRQEVNQLHFHLQAGKVIKK